MELGLDFWLELFVLLACLFYAAPRGGFTLGMIGGVGLIIFIFFFHMKPGKPPVDVILTILAVVCASATLQAWAVWTAYCRLPKSSCVNIRALFATWLRIFAGS